MPTISTGNPGWDQNLSTLGNALFPDPSKIGQAYYYGSEARRAQIEGARLQDQLAAMHTATGMQFGRQPNPTYAPGPLGVTIMQDPYAAQGPQQTAPPSLSSIVGGGPPPAPTASGMPAGGMPPQVLPPAAPGQPVHPAAMASTLAATAATSSPTAIGNGIVAGVENHSMTGQGADPTGSDGSWPQNGPGQLHPASVTSAGGGGPTYAPPAAPDGSPAPISFNFGQSAALMAQAGLGADVIRTVLPATLGNMVKNGQMPVPEAETLASYFGVPNMRVQTLSNQGALATANVAANASMANQRMVTGENARQFNLTPKVVGDAASGAPPVFMPQSQVAGQPAYEPSVAVQRQAQEGAFGNYFDPNKPGQVVHTTAKDATARGLQEGAKDPNQVNARMIEAIQAEKDPAKQQQMILSYQQMQATPTVMDPQAQKNQQKQDYDTNQGIYTVPQKGVVSFGVKEPVAFDAVADQAINQRAAALALQPENRFMRNDPTKAHEAAINDLQAHPLPDGRRLPTPAEVAQMRIPARTRLKTFGISGDPRIDTRVNPATGAASEHMMLHLMTEAEIAAATGKATPTGSPPGAPAAPAPGVAPNYGDPSTPAMPVTPAPVVPAAPPVPAPGGPPTAATIPQTLSQKLSTIMGGGSVGGFGLPGRSIWGAPAAAAPPAAAAAPATPAVSGGAPSGALGPAPAGSVEGQTGRSRSTGQAVVNRGGWLFPAQ